VRRARVLSTQWSCGAERGALKAADRSRGAVVTDETAGGAAGAGDEAACQPFLDLL